MKRINSKQHNAVPPLAAALALVLIFLTINARKAECLSTTTTTHAAAEGCNATRIADCLADDEEFLMESETSRRILAGKVKPFTPAAPVPRKPFCDRDVAASCIDRPNKFYDSRPCNYNNLCNRPGT